MNQMNQTQEAARQILGHVSDIQAITSMSGMTDVNLKLAEIRDKAAVLYGEPGRNGREIVEGYKAAADDAMMMLGELIESFSHRIETDLFPLRDADRSQIMRVAELFVSRSRVYFDRKTRFLAEEVQNG